MNGHRWVKNIAMLLAAVSVIGWHATTGRAQTAPEGKLPAVVTSCGQSPDSFIVKMLCDRIKLKVSYNSVLKKDELADFKSLIVVMGGSAKGLGAAGIDEPQELERVQSLLAKAREQKVVIFGVHVGGEARRGKLSASFVEQVTPRCDHLIVTEDGNKDGYFTKVSTEKQIPLTVIKDTQELGVLLKKTFAAN